MLTAFPGLTVTPEWLGYEGWCGLYWNKERSEIRQAFRVLLGASAANSPADLERFWFDAVTESKDAADEMQARTNAERRFARIRARLGFSNE